MRAATADVGVQKWVREAQAGDEAAFERLYARYARRVMRAVRGISGPDAEDVAHEAFLIAWERLDEYEARPGSTFASWLMTIALNVARMRRRRSRKLELSPEPRAEGSAAARQEGDAMGERRLMSLLATIPPRDREVLVLRYAAELSAAEVAEVAGLSEANVRKICQRRRDELLAAMGTGGSR